MCGGNTSYKEYSAKWRKVFGINKRDYLTESPEETIKKAMQEHSIASGLPKDWRNRILR